MPSGANMSAWCEFKIVWMCCADQKPLGRLEVPRALLSLQSVNSLTGVQIFPDAEHGQDGHWQFPRLSVGWYEEGDGYVVRCCETATSNPCLLARSGELSVPEIYIEHLGLSQELWPRELFVPYERVVQAVEHFLSTGFQHRQLDWVGLFDFPRHTVPPRPRLR